MIRIIRTGIRTVTVPLARKIRKTLHEIGGPCLPTYKFCHSATKTEKLAECQLDESRFISVYPALFCKAGSP